MYRSVAIYCILLGVSCSWITTLAQSNYASHANNVEYQGEGLPEEATLDGKVTKLDDLSPIIFLNRTKAALNCGAGSMQVDLKFNEKFYGIAYADFDRNSACQILGKGDLSYKLELPLKGCGTKQEPQRVFTNNIVVRFHPGLEMDGDEIITIVCRYPPPVAPIPAGLPAPILNDVVPASVVEAPLKGIQILLIICAIMFLTLLLLGLGVSYYCLRRRPVTVVRRLPMSMGSGSEITKLSGSSLGNISAFEGLKIPRAHAPLAAVHSSSGSDGPLISDTIPSDYPSESHSEIEEVDTRSLPVSSTGSFENRAFVQDNSSIYSEHYGHTQEFQAANAVAQASMVPRLPLAVKESSPKFDVQVRVKRAAPPPPASLSSDTDSVANTRIERNNLSTIMESHEDRDSILTIDSMPQDVAHSQFTYVPELHPAPRHVQAPPVFSRIVRKQQEMIQRQERQWPEDIVDAPPSIPDTRSIASLGTEMTDTHSIGEMIDSSHLYPISSYRSSIHMENTEAMPEPPIHVMRKPEITSHVQEMIQRQERQWPEDIVDAPPSIPDTRSIASLGTEMTDTHSIGEMIDSSHLYPISSYRSSIHMENTEAMPEPPIHVMRKPEITSHVVDDVFLRTITEKKTIEDIEKYKRKVTEYASAKPIPDPTWDVTIRKYATDEHQQPQWEDFSDRSSSISGVPLTPQMERAPLVNVPPMPYLDESGEKLRSPELVGNMKPIELPPEDKSVPNWDVLIRILEPEISEIDDRTSTESPVSFLTRQLSYEDKTKWKEIITTESTLRTMLTEAVVKEDFERIRSDARYESLFEPQSWDVIIRILAPPEEDVELRNARKFKKKEAWDTRSRRSSLPTLYEYDSDGGSSVRTISQDPSQPISIQLQQHRSRRTSRSSSTYRSDNVDMRSMSEVTVDFGRPDHLDNTSDASSHYPNRYYEDDPYDRRSLQRSLSQPSLARSASEFTERWVAPDTGSDMSSPDQTPKVRRSRRLMTTFQQLPSTSGSSQQEHVVAQSQYVEQRTSYQASGSVAPQDWYGDQGRM
uniref:Papillote n=1 Tax=Lutzomyia longipalpis TaxID=7200 RepID=A0A1B0GK04_LUTLO